MASPVLNQLNQRVMGSQGKKPGEWNGSQYIGPTAAPVAAPQVQPARVQAPAPAPATPATPAPFDREAFKQAWMGSGNTTNEQRDAFLQQQGGGLTADQSGRVRLPTGELIDMTLGAKAGGQGATWTGVAGQGLKAGQTAGPARGMGAGMASGAGYMNNAGGSAGGSFQDQTRALLMKQMQGLSGPVDPNDPSIKAAMDAARLESDRGVDQSRKEQAERQYAEGALNSNALGQGVQQFRERAAGGLSTLQGELMGRELTNRRASMAQLLNQALQTGDNEAARTLQASLAQMDNELRKRQLAQQGSQFDAGFGLDRGRFLYDQDRDAARAKAGMPF